LADHKASVGEIKFDVYKRAIQRFLKFIKPETAMASISVQDCRNFVTTQIEAGYAADTCRMTISRLRAMFLRATQDGYIFQNPWEGVKGPPKPRPRPRYLLPAEVKRLLASAKAERRLRWAVLAYTGARPSEALRITWRDVDFKNRSIRIVNAQKGAGVDANRVVPIIDELMPHLKLAKQESGEVLSGAHNWRRTLKADLQVAGVRADVTPYDLRHTFGTILAAAHVDLLIIRDLMGHSSIKTTEIYTHVIPTGHERTSRQVSNFLCRNSVDEKTG
jgi:integrase